MVAQPKFEVLAIHPSNSHGGIRGGPGTARPELITFDGALLSLTIMKAAAGIGSGALVVN